MNNEPAFPGLHPSAECRYQDQGMSLRDYFASKALNGMLSTKHWFGDNITWNSVEQMTDEYATEAYKFADAMMKSRSLGGE